MSSHDCGKHGHNHFNCGKHGRHVFFIVMAVLLLISLIVFVTYLVLHPSKPTFSLREASVTAFNLSHSDAASLLTSTFQVTLCSRNPNSRGGLFYDSLSVYASYRSQQITLSASLPPFFQSQKDVALWSPYLSGVDVPVAPYLRSSLEHDEGYGMVGISVKVNGKVRWKVGSYVSNEYHLDVDCPVVLAGIGTGGGGGGWCGGEGCLPVLKFQQMESCSVSL